MTVWYRTQYDMRCNMRIRTRSPYSADSKGGLLAVTCVGRVRTQNDREISNMEEYLKSPCTKHVAVADEAQRRSRGQEM